MSDRTHTKKDLLINFTILSVKTSAMILRTEPYFQRFIFWLYLLNLKVSIMSFECNDF